MLNLVIVNNSKQLLLLNSIFIKELCLDIYQLIKEQAKLLKLTKYLKIS